MDINILKDYNTISTEFKDRYILYQLRVDKMTITLPLQSKLRRKPKMCTPNPRQDIRIHKSKALSLNLNKIYFHQIENRLKENNDLEMNLW